LDDLVTPPAEVVRELQQIAATAITSYSSSSCMGEENLLRPLRGGATQDGSGDTDGMMEPPSKKSRFDFLATVCSLSSKFGQYMLM
jgi:hypothetical protein